MKPIVLVSVNLFKMIKKLELNMSNDKNDIRKLYRIFIYDEILLYVNFYHSKSYYKPGILRDKTMVNDPQ